MGRVGAGNLQLSNGFNSVLPLEHLAEFDASELELLLCGKPQHRRHCTNAPIHCWQARLSLGDCGARAGLPSIDMRDWQSNAEYRSGYTADHPVIQRFWQVVEAMGDDGRAKLLRFVTGTSALPAVTLNPPGFWVTLKSKKCSCACCTGRLLGSARVGRDSAVLHHPRGLGGGALAAGARPRSHNALPTHARRVGRSRWACARVLVGGDVFQPDHATAVRLVRDDAREAGVGGERNGGLRVEMNQAGICLPRV